MLTKRNQHLYLFSLGVLATFFFFVVINILEDYVQLPEGQENSNTKERKTLSGPNPLITDAPNLEIFDTDRPTLEYTSPQQGSLQPEVVIVEFSDFLCPYCARMHETIQNILLNSPYQVRWVWKDLPLTSIHPISNEAHVAARCAWKQKQFWPYADALFSAQHQLGTTFYQEVAEDLGLNAVNFENCLRDKSMQVFINFDVREAKVLGVSATPYLFLLSEKLDKPKRVSGALSEEELLMIIAEIVGESDSSNDAL